MPVNKSEIDVLVADDSGQMRAFHRSVLDMLGATRVREACDGGEAFRAICADAPDLLITDYGMAPQNGIDLTRSVRSDARSPNSFLPIVMVTAYTDKKRIGLARDSGVHAVLHKPVTPDELRHKIMEVIDDPPPFIRTRNYFGPDRRSGGTVAVRIERRALAGSARQ